ncbi:MAG: protein translocase subunit SecD [Caulobacterales bacterium]|nr:protein translocase subunit SecD [Caulobacterales bacterium]
MLYFAPWKIVFIALVVLAGLVTALPNVVPEEARFTEAGERQGVWRFLPANAVNLGLDLQGGSHLLLQVDINQVRDERLEGLRDDARTVLRAAEIAAQGFEIGDGFVTLRLTDAGRVGEATTVLEELSEPIQPGLGFGGPQSIAVDHVGDGQFRLSVTPEALEDIRRRTVAQSIEIIRRRIDALGTTEPLIQRQGQERVLVQAPGFDDPERLKQLIGQTAKMTFHMVASDSPRDIQAALEGRVSPLQELLQSEDPSEPYILVRKRASLSGDSLRRATQGFHFENGNPVVNFDFNQSGSRVFCRLTSENVGRRFATVLDGVVITAPRINSAICGGSGFIEGRFTVESASDLAALLSAGALPAELTIVEERSVGPSLGADSVAAGRIALIIGFVGVIIFMFAAYGLFGVFANVSLAANIALIAGALSLLQATLTLPGIAGIILTIGMAVDANVLIFERVREEMRSGRTPANALEAGYARARSAIFDANITTLIVAIILYLFGSGPVRGFAVTLSIGIVTSVFTAFVLSRYFIAMWFRAARPRALPI